ncbi:uncharacterized protein E0L32_008932 [Thyridium curvatum]|uniref:Glycerate-and formate-dehydrogenase n=1 Tax=Thyridium curvatum TaxID=1093900 RepID=A0A507B070_9PEZI|nr:uncharacterized protein E0L32_008932 [Thyridium curvatum]TPX09910.1 hypothetical protein E0L32_008932 [Thyridium curvatum]
MSPGRIDLGKRPRVVCLGQPKFVGDDYLAEFQEDFDFSVLEAYNHKETKEKLPLDIKKNGPIDAFIIRMGTPPYEPFDEEMFSMMAPSCKIVASSSAGYNEFPAEWLASKGVYLCNTIDAVAEATADMALFLTLAVLRNTTNAENSARNGTWRAASGLVPARDPSGLTMGIVGLGSIGKVNRIVPGISRVWLTSVRLQYLAKKAAVFNINIRYYNRNRLPREEEAKYNATYCSSLHELLSSSDIVSLNCPLNANTTNLIGPKEFAAMKDGTFLINTARGSVVDEAALKQALESGKVTRAGLDVFCDEPNVDKWFLESDKVVIQPHLGGLTDMAFQRGERECFENIKAYFSTGVPNSAVLPLKN